MKIVIANIWLMGTGGTECWCWAMADELRRRGHDVALYTPNPGRFLERTGHRVATPGESFDLVLDNHGVSLGKFGGVTVHTCHGVIPAESPMPTADANVAVSKRVAKRWGLKDIITNGVDTDRFRNITEPGDSLRRVLSLCKSKTADAMLAEACRNAGVELRTTFGRESFDVENVINGADLVVGVGRSVLDAMSCARPVVSFDDRSYYAVRFHGGGYIRRDQYRLAADDNFTGVSTGKSWDASSLAGELKKYNPADGYRNRLWILKNHSVAASADKYLKIYGEICGKTEK